MSSQTVFVPFRYCPLCRLNHKKGKKHVYSKKHKEIVASILKKFLKKITDAKEFLKKPSIKDITWDQTGNKFWCYFCQGEMDKHRLSQSVSGQCVVEHGGFLEHITRSDHAANTAKFLKENMLEMKRTPEFIINEKVYLKFLEDVESTITQFFVLKLQALTQIASQIRSQSLTRCDVVASSLREQNLQQPSHPRGAETRWPKPVKGPTGLEEKGKKTVQAFGEGLTPIERPDEDDSAGNIYTNAVPPWMQSNQDTAPSSCVVGPTMEDLEKHNKLERKRQLPACRVGAKFDHKSGDTGMWLPDFGGVWNHGRRTKSGHQFIKRQKRGASSHSSSSSTLSGGSVDSPFFLPPSSYSLPRRTATVTSGSDILTNSNHGQIVDNMATVATNLDRVFPLSVSQNTEFGYHQDSDMSPSTSRTSSAVATSLTGNAFKQMPNTVDTGNSVVVKPYVRKNRNTSSTVLGQNQPMPLQYSHQIPPHCLGLDNMNTRNSASEAHTHSSFNSEISFTNHSLISGNVGHWHNNSTAYKRPEQSSQSFVYNQKQDLNTGPLRLLTTPVLSQKKSKLPSTQLFGTGKNGK